MQSVSHVEKTLQTRDLDFHRCSAVYNDLESLYYKVEQQKSEGQLNSDSHFLREKGEQVCQFLQKSVERYSDW